LRTQVADPTSKLADNEAKLASVDAITADHDKAVERANAAEAARNAAVAEATAARVEQDGAIADKEIAANERDKAIENRDSAFIDRDSALARANKAESDRAGYAAKFDILYGDPTEDEGITRGPRPYLTSDGVSYPTLQEARVHMVRAEAGVSHQQAQHLISRADTLIPLIQNAAGAKP